MKTKQRLPKLCCRLFALLEILCVLGTAIVCVGILAISHVKGHAELALAVGLTPELGAFTVKSDDPKSGAISVRDLQGTLHITNPEADSDLLALARWHTLPLVVAFAGFLVALFDLLRRLFRNVARGESFTERTVGLVQKIGMTIILFTLLSAAGTAWHNHVLITYLQQHAAVQGIKMTFTNPGGDTLVELGSKHLEFQISWGGIRTGLLVLALGEVFRQGLALKTESDLTI